MPWPPSSGRVRGALKSLRIREARDFADIRRFGMRRSGESFQIIVWRHPADRRSKPLERVRLAVVTSRKVGGAVERNRWRRRVREAFRQCCWQELAQREDVIDVMVTIRAGAKQLTYQELCLELKRLLKLHD